MPKKRTTRRPHGGSRSLAQRAATMPPLVALRMISPGLAAWAVDVEALAPGSSPAQLLADVTRLVEVAVEHGRLVNLFAWTPRQITATLEAVLDDDVLTLDDEEAYRVATSIHPLIDHLIESEQWVGPRRDLAAVDEAIEDALGDDDDPLDPFMTPEMAQAAAEMLAELTAVTRDPMAQHAALGTLAIVTDVESLLRWLAPSRPITSTGVLRPADLPEAAAALGVSLPGRPPQAMGDVEALVRVWTVAHGGGLIDVGEHHVELTGVARDWLAADPGEPPSAPDDEDGPATTGRASVVLGLVDHLLHIEPDDPMTPPPFLALVPWLVTAATGTPVPLDDTEGDPTAVTDTMRAAASARVVLNALADEGVVVIDATGSSFTITPGLEHLVAVALTLEIAEELGLDLGLDE